MENLISYRTFLLERFRPSTVNTRICAINRYLDYLEKTKPRGNCQQETARLKVVKCQPKTFVDTVISRKDYNKLKKKLEAEENWFWYFLVRVMACTGVRVSELVQIKVEHIRDSYMDICSKGSKTRRIYFPHNLQQEMLAWLGQENHQSGLIFINKSGQPPDLQGNQPETESICPALPHPRRSHDSPFLPPPFRSKFSGSIQRYHLAGGPFRPQQPENYPNLSDQILG